MPTNPERINRFLKILNMMSTRYGYTIKEMAEACGVSSRTTYRDIEDLREGNIPIVKEDRETARYKVRDGFYLNIKPLQLTVPESLAILKGLDPLQKHTKQPYFQAAKLAAAKIEQCLPDSVKNAVQDLSPKITIWGEKLSVKESPLTGIAETLRTIEEAIVNGKAIKMLYASRGKEQKEIRLYPYAVWFPRRAWYVIGVIPGSGGKIYQFKLNRIQNIEITSEEYVIPSDFTIEGYIGNAWHSIPSDETYEVVIRFDDEIADLISETQWHKTQQIEEHDDGSITFRATVDGLDEISWWIMQYADHAEVIEPKELREKIKRMVEGMMKVYGKISLEN